jgi:nucleoside-diphosphate-sugar epimerase
VSNLLGRGGIFQSDLDEIISLTKNECAVLKNQEITILGGSGFVGIWLISFLCTANEQLDLNLNIIAPTRNVETARNKLKLKAKDPVSIVEVDFSKVLKTFSTQSKFYFLALTPTVKSTGSDNGELILASTQNAIAFIEQCAYQSGICPTVIHLSSGAVYQDSKSEVLNEKNVEATTSKDAYTQAKLLLETSLLRLDEVNLIKAANPRLFAFMGPHLKIDEHFAVGNFLNDCLKGREIIVKGNPLTTRSYLYPTDLVTWLIKILIRPTNLPLNFGSDKSLTMKEIAESISNFFDNKNIEYRSINSPISHYVPSIENTKKYLGVTQKILFSEGLERWIKWLKN